MYLIQKYLPHFLFLLEFMMRIDTTILLCHVKLHILVLDNKVTNIYTYFLMVFIYIIYLTCNNWKTTRYSIPIVKFLKFFNISKKAIYSRLNVIFLIKNHL